MSEIKNRVLKLLTDYPATRDNDNLLISAIWREDLHNIGLNSAITAHELLWNLSEGKLTHFESIRRCRQMIQESIPYLRGNRYKERKEVLEQDMRESIREGDLSTLLQ